MFSFLHKKKVWLSGITGFKGAWLTMLLLQSKCEIVGYSLEPSTNPSLFQILNLKTKIKTWQCSDIRYPCEVENSISSFQPDFLFHLAAQPLVRQSYLNPVETYEVNLMGTIHVLQALRKLKNKCVALIITTDKCYENREWIHAYREEDPLGGFDPYSSSKAACEIAISSWRRSFFQNHPVRIAAVRAGNVIGGGDWAQDRIVPDAIRALQQGRPIPIRNPNSTRPWQHVLEPLSGYLMLAQKLWEDENFLEKIPNSNSPFAHAFNFGPNLDSNRTVRQLVDEILKHWQGSWEHVGEPNAPHEASKLNLATDKAFHLLGWQPRWSFEKTIEKTVEWYRSFWQGADPIEITHKQIQEYFEGFDF